MSPVLSEPAWRVAHAGAVHGESVEHFEWRVVRNIEVQQQFLCPCHHQGTCPLFFDLVEGGGVGDLICVARLGDGLTTKPTKAFV